MTTRSYKIGDALVLAFCLIVLVALVAWLSGADLTGWWRP